MSDQQQHSGPPSPGPEHKMLAAFEGTFRAKVTIYFGPEHKHESTGTMRNVFQLGGLYLHQDYTGDPSEGPFPEFMGKGYWGYNTTNKKFEGFWIDNASTMMQLESGTVDSTGKVWTMISTFQNPQTGESMVKRSVIEVIDQNRHRMDSYFAQGDQPESKTMVIEYTRAD